MSDDARGDASLSPDTAPELYEGWSAPLSGFDASAGTPHAADAGAFSRPLTVGTVLRFKWLVLGVIVAVVLAALPPIWLLLKPRYQATATVRVAPVVHRLVFRTEENNIVPLYWSYVQTQVEMIQSPTVLTRVLEKPEVRESTWYNAKPEGLRARLGGTEPTPLERLAGSLTVESEQNTELIKVQVTTRLPADSALLVNAIVDEYVRLSEERAQETDKRRFATLIEEREAVQQEVDALLDRKYGVSRDLGILHPEDLRAQLSEQLGELEAELERTRREYQTAVWELDRLPKEVVAKSGDSLDEMPTDIRLAMDAEWRRLRMDAKSAQSDLEIARQTLGEAHPRITELRTRLEQAKDMVAEREAQLQVQWQQTGTTTVVTPEEGKEILDRPTLERRVARLKRQTELLSESVAAQRDKVKHAGELAKELAQYDEELRRKQALYEQLSNRVNELEMESKAPGRISVASHGVEPAEPFKDRRFLLSVMSLGAAAMLALSIVHLRSRPRINEAEDVQQVMGVPFLGQIPLVPGGRRIAQGGHPLLTECMRMVRTALLKRLGSTAHRVVVVTGASSQVGKTTVAVELARSLAHVGKRTLLVEADLHRPVLAERLGLTERPGLADVLTGAARDKQVIMNSGTNNLDFVTAGLNAESLDTDRLANGAFSGCLSRWRKAYDFVLLDTPPVLPVADARIISGQADGAIMVLRSSHCRRADVSRAYADLSAAGGVLLGTVLVGSPSGRGYGYGYGYGYGGKPQEADPSRALT